jgi:hypothetical protein
MASNLVANFTGSPCVLEAFRALRSLDSKDELGANVSYLTWMVGGAQAHVVWKKLSALLDIAIVRDAGVKTQSPSLISHERITGVTCVLQNHVQGGNG